jgi:hypothetical protein
VVVALVAIQPMAHLAVLVVAAVAQMVALVITLAVLAHQVKAMLVVLVLPWVFTRAVAVVVHLLSGLIAQ